MRVHECVCLCVCAPVLHSRPQTYFPSVYVMSHWWLYESDEINGGIPVFLPVGPRLSIGDNYSRGWL